MAKENPTTPTGGATLAALTAPPVLAIPDDAEVAEQVVEFPIHTGDGRVGVGIAVRLDDVRVCCQGSWEALVAAGIVMRDWLVTNRISSWCICFDGGMPSQRIGTRGRPKGQYMRIFYVHGEYRADWCVTGTQAAALATRIEKLWAASGKARQQEVQRQSTERALPPEAAHRVMKRNTDIAIDWWKNLIKDTGCRYTDDSMNGIHLAFEALRQAVADGCVVSVQPEQVDRQRVGNVICWPGRGSVAAVELNASGAR